MSNLIQNLHIQNFKSVRDLSLDCDRINIFIGKPNAGKSNILEAISLLGAGYSEGRFMEGFIRYKTVVQLFSDFNFREPLVVRADSMVAWLKSEELGNNFTFSIASTEDDRSSSGSTSGYFIHPLSKRLLVDGSAFVPNPKIKVHTLPPNIKVYGGRHNPDRLEKTNRNSPIKKYDFHSLNEYKEKGLFLQPPHGENFYFIARTHPQLREEIGEFLKPNGLDFLLDEETQRPMVVQKQGSSLLSFPLHLVPDTFQRYIFHLAAIMSNRNSVLLFEEPESHSYAPYIYQLAQHILDDEGGNQYFITTHNPYFLLPIMQEGKDVAVFATWFQDYQTHARRLSETEIREVLDYGVDVFLNFDHFIPE